MIFFGWTPLLPNSANTASAIPFPVASWNSMFVTNECLASCLQIWSECTVLVACDLRCLYFHRPGQLLLEIFPTFLSVRHQLHLEGTVRYHLKLCKNRNWCWFVSKSLSSSPKSWRRSSSDLNFTSGMLSIHSHCTHLKSTRTALFCFVSPFLRASSKDFLISGPQATKYRNGSENIKIRKVNKLYLSFLLVSIFNRVSRSGTMKYQWEWKHRCVKQKWLLT